LNIVTRIIKNIIVSVFDRKYSEASADWDHFSGRAEHTFSPGLAKLWFPFLSHLVPLTSNYGLNSTDQLLRFLFLPSVLIAWQLLKRNVKILPVQNQKFKNQINTPLNYINKSEFDLTRNWSKSNQSSNAS